MSLPIDAAHVEVTANIISGMVRGFLTPTFIFPICLPLHKSMRISPIPSVLLGSSKANGMVDLQHLSKTSVSEVLLVFMRCPVSCCPMTLSPQSAAVDLPNNHNFCN